MTVLMFAAAVLNACVAGAFAATIGWSAALGNILILVVICVDQLCEAIKERK